MPHEEGGLEAPHFMLTVTEACSVYALLCTFREDLEAGVEEKIASMEASPKVRDYARTIIPNLISDMKDFLSENLPFEMIQEVSDAIERGRGNKESP